MVVVGIITGTHLSVHIIICIVAIACYYSSSPCSKCNPVIRQHRYYIICHVWQFPACHAQPLILQTLPENLLTSNWPLMLANNCMLEIKTRITFYSVTATCMIANVHVVHYGL